MKYILVLLIASSLLSCQKENEAPENLFTAYDSLVGDWVYESDYVLISSQSNPTVITDSDFVGHYAPLSYFKINPDSSYRWWRTEMTTQPVVGYGVSGKIVVINDSMRYIQMNQITTTDDNFTTQTALTPVTMGPPYKIKLLTNNRMVLTFTVPSSDGRLFHWHDVYTR